MHSVFPQVISSVLLKAETMANTSPLARKLQDEISRRAARQVPMDTTDGENSNFPAAPPSLSVRTSAPHVPQHAGGNPCAAGAAGAGGNPCGSGGNPHLDPEAVMNMTHFAPDQKLEFALQAAAREKAAAGGNSCSADPAASAGGNSCVSHGVAPYSYGPIRG